MRERQACTLRKWDELLDDIQAAFAQLTPVLKNLLDAATAAGAIRADVDARELLLAGARLATPASEGDIPQARRMVALLVDGLRYGGAVRRKAVR